MTSLNEHISRVKKNRHWVEDGLVYCRLGGGKHLLTDEGCGCSVKKRTPDYSGDLVLSDEIFKREVHDDAGKSD